MEYLVTMTTRVPDGTPEQAVDEVRAREAAHSRDLAAQGHLLRLWRLPRDAPGDPGVLGLWRAQDMAAMQAIVRSLPSPARRGPGAAARRESGRARPAR